MVAFGPTYQCRQEVVTVYPTPVYSVHIRKYFQIPILFLFIFFHFTLAIICTTMVNSKPNNHVDI